MRQTSRPERTRSLANRDLDLGHIDLAAQAPVDFPGGRGLEKQRERLGEVVARLGHGRALARDIDLGAERHVAVALAFDDSGQASVHRTHPVRDPSSVCIAYTLSQAQVHIVRPPAHRRLGLRRLCPGCFRLDSLSDEGGTDLSGLARSLSGGAFASFSRSRSLRSARISKRATSSGTAATQRRRHSIWTLRTIN